MLRRLSTSAERASDMTTAGIYGSHCLRIDDVVDHSVEHQSALMQHDDSGRDFAHELEVMFDQDDRVTGFAREMPQDRADGHALRLGEACGRLVKQNELRFERKDHGELKCLFHAVRQKTGGGSD